MSMTDAQLGSALASLVADYNESADANARNTFIQGVTDLFQQAGLVLPTTLAAALQGHVDVTEQWIVQFRAWAAGTANGGPSSDGFYPIVDRNGTTVLIPSPAKVRTELFGLTPRGTVATVAALDLIEAYEIGDVWTVQENGRAYAWGLNEEWIDLGKFEGPSVFDVWRGLAGNETKTVEDYFQWLADAQKDEVQPLLDAAEEARDEAQSARDAAVAAQTAAQASQTAAATSATTASTGATTATTKAAEAVSARDAAVAAQTAAETARNTAQTHATTATTKAGEATTAATTATTKAGEANTSATNAAASATTATTKAGEATTAASTAVSARNAAQAAETAAEDAQAAAQAAATTATGAATTATTKANEASTARDEAVAARNTASTHATTATTKASEASTSAATATTKANDAETARAAAVVARTAAETARTDAQTAATNAAGSASTASTASSTAVSARDAAITARNAAQAAQAAAEEARDDAQAIAGGNYQPSDPTLTAVAGQTWTSGKLVFAMTAQDVFTPLSVGVESPTSLLDRQSGDARFLSFNKSDVVVDSYEPVDLASRGGNAHFCYGRRSNLLLRSQEIDNSTWVKTGGVTVTANAYVSPRETTEAERLNAGSAGGGVEQVVTHNATGWACFPVWLFSPSAQGGEQVQLVLDTNGTSAESFSKTVTLIPGWGRYFVAGNFTAAHTQKRVRVLNGAAVIGMWGAQLDTDTAIPRGYHATSTGQAINSSHVAFFTSFDGTFTGVFSRGQSLTTARSDAITLSSSSAASSGTPIRMSPSIRYTARVWNGTSDVSINNWIEVIPTVSGANFEYVWRIHDGTASIFEVEGRSGVARSRGKRLLNEDDLTAISTEITTAINNVIAGAPGALDTLNEIAQALADDDTAINNLITQVAGKANASHTHSWGDIVSGRPTTLAGYGITDAVSQTTTGLGRTGAVPFDTPNTALAWSLLPVGYSRMINSTVGTAGGAPVSNFGYFTKIANRDTAEATAGPGWGGLWIGYSTGQTYVGRSPNGNTMPTWEQVWTSGNFDPNSKANTSHTHDASAITSGTLNEARIPSLPISRVAGLQTEIDSAKTRLNALESGGGGASAGTLTYTNGLLTSVVEGSKTTTLNYTNGLLTSIVEVNGAQTKTTTMTYTNGIVTGYTVS